MVQSNFKLTICSILASVIVFNSISFANMTCEVSASQKVKLDKSKSLEDFYGEHTWEVRLAAAELLHKYDSSGMGKTNAGKVQLDHVTQLLLNALVSGHLSVPQFTLLDGYQDYLINARDISVLVSRSKLSSLQTTVKPPKVVSESLVGVRLGDGDSEASTLSQLVDKLNPATYFNKKNKAEKKYGPVTQYINAESAAEDLRRYAEGDRLPVLKYNLDLVDMLAPQEIIHLLREIPMKSQLAVLEFLEPKRIGRYDFFPESLIGDAQVFLQPEVTLKIISAGGDNWTLPSIISTLKDNPAISSEAFGKYLSSNYSPAQILEHLNGQQYISLREAQILLSLILPNAHDEVERKTYYSQINHKLYDATDKQKLEELFKNKNLAKNEAAAKNITSAKAISEVKLFSKSTSKDIAAIRGLSPKALLLILGITGSGFIYGITDLYQRGLHNTESYAVTQTETLQKPVTQSEVGEKYLVTENQNLNKNNIVIDTGDLSPDQFDNLIDNTKDEKIKISLLEARLNSAKKLSAEDFVSTLKFDSDFLSANFKAELARVWKANIKNFIELNPTNEEFVKAKRACPTPEIMIELAKARLKFGNLKTVEDVLATFDQMTWASDKDTAIANKGLDALKIEYFKLNKNKSETEVEGKNVGGLNLRE